MGSVTFLKAQPLKYLMNEQNAAIEEQSNILYKSMLKWLEEPQPEQDYVFYTGAGNRQTFDKAWEEAAEAYHKMMLQATIPEGEYKLMKEPLPKKKEKPHPEFGG